MQTGDDLDRDSEGNLNVAFTEDNEETGWECLRYQGSPSPKCLLSRLGIPGVQSRIKNIV